MVTKGKEQRGMESERQPGQATGSVHMARILDFVWSEMGRNGRLTLTGSALRAGGIASHSRHVAETGGGRGKQGDQLPAAH